MSESGASLCSIGVLKLVITSLPLERHLRSIKLVETAQSLRSGGPVDPLQQPRGGLLKSDRGFWHTEKTGRGVTVVCLDETWVHCPRGKPPVGLVGLVGIVGGYVN
ncbi:hypothetical protein QQS21_009504 [Conoideocrella luteorostrata]|uniref:Uncharacterized protein n=1 Tax=Conoideocrella luteorostrata TaxID=1105319 RepID=A0AAJ0FXQ9_9HYPO|nr:hypothetical protein QQS21_009504 [Conoideocrella luteorostrata]